MRSIPLLPLLLGPLCSGFGVSISIPSMGQIELFNHLLRINIISYLKQYNCVQISWVWLGWVGFYDMSTILDYFMSNPVRTYILNI